MPKKESRYGVQRVSASQDMLRANPSLATATTGKDGKVSYEVNDAGKGALSYIGLPFVSSSKTFAAVAPDIAKLVDRVFSEKAIAGLTAASNAYKTENNLTEPVIYANDKVVASAKQDMRERIMAALTASSAWNTGYMEHCFEGNANQKAKQPTTGLADF